MGRYIFSFLFLSLSYVLYGQRQDTLYLENVIVQGLREAHEPVNQVRISLEEKEEIGAEAHFFLSQQSPSLRVTTDTGTGYSGYGRIFLRGMEDHRMNFTLNGVPLSDVLDNGMYLNNFTDLLGGLSEIRIQRGLSISHQGSSSYAGVVDFISVPIWEEGFSVRSKIRGGSFNTYGASLSHHHVSPGGLASYLRVSGLESAGYKHHSDTRNYSSFFSGGFRDGKHVTKWNILWGHAENNLSYLPEALSEINKDNRVNSADPRDRDNYTQALLSGEYSYFLSSSQVFSFLPYYGFASGYYPFSYSYEVEGSPSFFQNRYHLQNHHIGGIGYWTFQPLSAYKLKVGLHAYSFHRDNKESLYTGVESNPYYHDQSQKQEGSIWIKNSYVWKAFSWYGDLQFRQLRISFDPDTDFLGQNPILPTRSYTFLNPWTGLTWSITKRLSFRSSIGQGYREPRRVDILGGGTINPDNLSSVQNIESLRPESVIDWENGLYMQFEKMQISGHAFYLFFEDEIMPIGDFLAAYYTQLSKNVEQSFRRGVELSWEGSLFEDIFFFSGNGTWMQTQIQSLSLQGISYEEVRAPYTPQWQARLTPGLAWGGLRLSLTAEYVGEAFLDLSNQTHLTWPAYALLSSAFSWGHKGHRFILRAQNLSQTEYYLYGVPSLSNEPSYLIGPPRSFFAEWRYEF
ncbi:MAG: TonB-dependent receptor [Cytophagales bacterium]|nr:TonB-dependent receptor [Cytophagales bacterium]